MVQVLLRREAGAGPGPGARLCLGKGSASRLRSPGGEASGQDNSSHTSIPVTCHLPRSLRVLRRAGGRKPARGDREGPGLGVTLLGKSLELSSLLPIFSKRERNAWPWQREAARHCWHTASHGIVRGFAYECRRSTGKGEDCH